MHLGFLTPEYPHPRVISSAGIGTSIRNTADGLISEGIEVSVFIYGQEEDAVFKEKGIKIHLIRQRKYKFLGWYLYRKFLQDYLNKYIAADKIRAIEAPDWTGITAFMKLLCPLVIKMHGSDAYFCKLEKRPQKKKNFWFEKRALKGADKLLSVSKFTARLTVEIFQLKSQVEVIPNSVNTSFFKPFSGEIESDTIIYFGSLIRKKGLFELAQIFNLVTNQNPNVRLLLIGKDVKDIIAQQSSFELFKLKLNEEAKERVEHIPEVSYERIRSYIASAEVIVLPSFAEALPMTWLEAMAMEKTLVTSNIGWAKEIMVDGKTGFMVCPKEHQDFATKILFLLNNPAEAAIMGKNARQQVLNKFSTQVVVQQNILFYNNIGKK